MNTKTENVSYFSRATTADEFGRAALYDWQEREGDKTKRVVSVNDGAAWIQSFIDYHCPQAIRVLDFAHAQSYVATIGKAIYGAESDTFPPWFAQMSKQLGKNHPSVPFLIYDFYRYNIQRIHSAQKLSKPCVISRNEMIPHYRKEQIPIGSGVVESAHKVVMQKRMKQAGQ